MAAAALLVSVEARKTYLVKSERNLLTQPRVRNYDYTRCLKENEDTSICFDVDVNWEIGWQWYQEQVVENLYRLRLEFYSKQDGVVHPEYNYPRFIYQEWTWTLYELTTMLAFDMVYHYPVDYLCFNIYYKWDEIHFEMLMSQKLQECLKVLINCFYDYSQWTGEDAKYFEGCSQSSKEDVSVYTKDKDEAIGYLFGATDATTLLGTDCSPKDGFWPLFSASRQEKRMFFNLLNYLSSNQQYKTAFKI